MLFSFLLKSLINLRRQVYSQKFPSISVCLRKSSFLFNFWRKILQVQNSRVVDVFSFNFSGTSHSFLACLVPEGEDECEYYLCFSIGRFFLFFFLIWLFQALSLSLFLFFLLLSSLMFSTFLQLVVWCCI
jgi:hypothetical protein